MRQRRLRYVDNATVAEIEQEVIFLHKPLNRAKWLPSRIRERLAKPVPVGRHGYAVLTFAGDKLTVEYRGLKGDIDKIARFLRREHRPNDAMEDEPLLTETFQSVGNNVVCIDEQVATGTDGGPLLAPFGPPPLVRPRAVSSGKPQP